MRNTISEFFSDDLYNSKLCEIQFLGSYLPTHRTKNYAKLNLREVFRGISGCVFWFSLSTLKDNIPRCKNNKIFIINFNTFNCTKLKIT